MKVPDKLLDYLMLVLAAAMILYHLAATRVLIFGPVLHFNTHLMFGFVLVYLALARYEPKWRWAWLVGAFFSVIVFGYVYLFANELVDRAFFNTDLDLIMGALMIILALVATWKALGSTLTIFAAMCIGYFYTCGNLPGFLHGPNYPLYRLIPSLAIGLQTGMYGVAMSVSANMIFLFMVFGGLLQASGVIKFFYEVGKLLGRRLSSGAAQATIVGGGMAGTITGSAASDAMIVGPFTVPFMKNAGYKGEEAGAIMAVSSTGAQIMPPVLGAAAFALCAVTGVSYARVCLASIIPAIFYFTGLGLAVHLYTLRHLKIEKIKAAVDYKLLATVTPSFLIPVGTLVGFLAQGYSAQYAACMAIVALFIAAAFRKETRYTWAKFKAGLVSGAQGGAQIAVCSAAIGFIISSLTDTGLAAKLPIAVEAWSGGNLMLACMWIFFICIILGCGMPTMTIYFTVAIVAAPALIKLGAPLFSSHLFVMWAGIFSYITPPVAIASMVCAKLADAPFVKTGMLAVRYAGVSYVLPFLIMLCPAITFQDTRLVPMVTQISGCFGILFALSIAIEGYWFIECRSWERVLALLSFATLFFALWIEGLLWLLLAGFAILAFITLRQLKVKCAAAALKVENFAGNI